MLEEQRTNRPALFSPWLCFPSAEADWGPSLGARELVVCTGEAPGAKAGQNRCRRAHWRADWEASGESASPRAPRLPYQLLVCISLWTQLPQVVCHLNVIHPSSFTDCYRYYLSLITQLENAECCQCFKFSVQTQQCSG